MPVLWAFRPPASLAVFGLEVVLLASPFSTEPLDITWLVMGALVEVAHVAVEVDIVVLRLP